MSTAYHMPETMSLADRLADINTRYVSRMRIPDEPTSRSPTDASANNSKQPHSLNPLDPRSAAEEAEEVSRGGGVAAGEDTDELHSIAERPYNGDKFSTRGEYTSALVYLSRMKVSSHVAVKGVCCMQDRRLGGELGKGAQMGGKQLLSAPGIVSTSTTVRRTDGALTATAVEIITMQRSRYAGMNAGRYERGHAR